MAESEVEEYGAKSDLVRRMQEIASQNNVEAGGDFYELGNGRYTLAFHKGAYDEIGLLNLSHGQWHSHTTSVEDLLESPRDCPSEQDLFTFICRESAKEHILVGPLFTIQLRKSWDNNKKPPMATYMRQVYETAISYLKEIRLEDLGLLNDVCVGIAINQFIKRYGDKFSLKFGERDIWAKFAALAGIRIEISENDIFNPKYNPEQLRRIIPRPNSQYEPQIDIGTQLFQELMKPDRIMQEVRQYVSQYLR